MKNWKTIKSKTVFECKYFKIEEEDFKTKNGKTHKYYILDRKNYVVVIPIENGFVYLVEQYRHTIKTKLIELVIGAMEDGETSLKAAKKELEEEAGIKAKKFTNLGWYYSYKGCSGQKGFVFLAEGLKFGEQKLEELEREGEMKVIKVKISEVEEMIKSRIIKDAETIASFNIFMLKYKSSFN